MNFVNHGFSARFFAVPIFYPIKNCNRKISAKIGRFLILAEIFVNFAGIIKYNVNEENIINRGVL